MISRKPTEAPLPTGAFILNGRVYIRTEEHEARQAFSVDDGDVVDVPIGETTPVKMER